jgi:hypothetical protein
VQRCYREFNDVVDAVFDARGVDCETVFRSDRDDWVLAMVASGFGFFPNTRSRTGTSLRGRWSIRNFGVK